MRDEAYGSEFVRQRVHCEEFVWQPEGADFKDLNLADAKTVRIMAINNGAEGVEAGYGYLGGTSDLAGIAPGSYVTWLIDLPGNVQLIVNSAASLEVKLWWC